jgi:hypothetical protein
MWYIRMGNDNPKQAKGRDEDDRPVFNLAEAFVAITIGGDQSIWGAHSYDAAPTWVEVDGDEGAEGLAQLLASHFHCPIGVPDDLEKTHHTVFGPPGTGPDEELAATKKRSTR